MKKVLFIFLGLVFLMIGIVGCNGDDEEPTIIEQVEQLDDLDDVIEVALPERGWPTRGLATRIPAPDEDEITIFVNTDERFTVDVFNVSREIYETYVDDVIAMGFVIDYRLFDDYYVAYHADGYRFHASFFEDELRMTVNIRVTG